MLNQLNIFKNEAKSLQIEIKQIHLNKTAHIQSADREREKKVKQKKIQKNI